MSEELNEYIENLPITDKEKLKLYSLIGISDKLNKRGKF